MNLPRGEHIARWKGQERRDAYNVPPGPLEWLLELLHDAGGVASDINGIKGLGWAEMAAWMQGSGIEPEPQFRRDMMRLSGVTADMMVKAQEMACQVPFEPD